MRRGKGAVRFSRAASAARFLYTRKVQKRRKRKEGRKNEKRNFVIHSSIVFLLAEWLWEQHIRKGEYLSDNNGSYSRKPKTHR